MAVQGTVTIVFTDLVGSTAMAARLGEEAADAYRQRHFALLERAARVSGGEVVKNLGDGVMVAYRAAADALSGAVGMQQAIDADNRRGRGQPMGLRVGMALGDVTFEEDDYFGAPVIQAARLCARAEGGQILASEVVRVLAGGRGGHRFSKLGDLDLKGLPDPVAAVEVDWDPLPPGSTFPLPVALGGADQFPFVGREEESVQLRQAFERASAGERRAVLVTGEPGIGKTRLAAELAREMHGCGAMVLYGRCDEDMGVPYQPLVEALRHFADHVHPEELPARLGAYGGELTRLVPELAQRAPQLPPPLKSDAETERYRLFHAVMDWLRACSDEDPVVVVLDDLQWATKDTALLLRHVLSAPDSLRLLVVGTYRDTEAGAGSPVTELVADLWRAQGAERVPLDGLVEGDMGGFLAAVGRAGDADADALARTVHVETAGNPFFVSELVRHLVEAGDASLEERAIPRGVREVVERRLARMSEAAVAALRLASVLGEVFDNALLEHSLGTDVLEVLDEAAAARLVSEAGPRQYRFAHALVRATLYDDLSAARRLRLHRQAAEAIEAVYAAHLQRHLRELAYHFAQVASGGEAVDKAIDYATRAGADALAHLAPDDALRWYRQALELMERAGEADERDRCALLIGLGDAQRQTGDPNYRETLLAAAEIAQHLDDTDLLVRAAIANSTGQFSRLYAVDPERLAVLDAARVATEGTATPERAQLLATLAGELTFGDRTRVRPVADEAIALARGLGDDSTRVIVASRLEAAVRAPDNLTQRVTLAAEAVAAAERTGDPVLRWTAASQGFMPAFEAGDIEAFHERVDVVERLADHIGRPEMRWLAGVARTLREAVAGRFDRAEQFSAEALEIGGNIGQADAFIYYAGFLLAIRIDQGRLSEVSDFAEAAFAGGPDFPVVRAGRALVYCELGRTAEARSILEAEAAEGFSAVPFDLSWANAMNVYARVVAALDDHRAAALLVDLIEPWRDQIASSYFGMGSLAHSLGLALATTGRYDEAENAFKEAAAVHERIGAPVLLAQTRLEWGRMLGRRDREGDRERAHELADAALDVAAELGAGAIERGARELLESLDAQEDRPVP